LVGSYIDLRRVVKFGRGGKLKDERANERDSDQDQYKKGRTERVRRREGDVGGV
jgi:hypothetical protein